MPGLAPTRAEQRLFAIIGGLALLLTGPGAVGYFASDAGLATGATIWIIGSLLLFAGARRLVRLPVVVEMFGGIAMLAGAALTGIQSQGFAPIFGIVTALGLVALGMLPGQVLLSVLGSIGLLINVPWAIAWFFPGEGRAPLTRTHPTAPRRAASPPHTQLTRSAPNDNASPPAHLTYSARCRPRATEDEECPRRRRPPKKPVRGQRASPRRVRRSLGLSGP